MCHSRFLSVETNTKIANWLHSFVIIGAGVSKDALFVSCKLLPRTKDKAKTVADDMVTFDFQGQRDNCEIKIIQNVHKCYFLLYQNAIIYH